MPGQLREARAGVGERAAVIGEPAVRRSDIAFDLRDVARRRGALCDTLVDLPAQHRLRGREAFAELDERAIAEHVVPRADRPDRHLRGRIVDILRRRAEPGVRGLDAILGGAEIPQRLLDVELRVGPMRRARAFDHVVGAFEKARDSVWKLVIEISATGSWPQRASARAARAWARWA